VEVVHVGAAAAEQELAQDRRLVVLHPHAARLDEINPRILEQARIVERQQDRILDLDGGGGLDAARQVLFRRRGIDPPRLAVEVLRHPRALEHMVVLDADEAPLQAGEAIIWRRR
jgi:hypothetical protein